MLEKLFTFFLYLEQGINNLFFGLMILWVHNQYEKY